MLIMSGYLKPIRKLAEIKFDVDSEQFILNGRPVSDIQLRALLDIRQEASQAYREIWDEEPPESFVALELARRLESLRRRELLLQKPSLREWTLQQPEEYWTELTQSWMPKDWQQRVESGEFNTPPQD